MKTIIAGSRTITDYPAVERAILEFPWEITHVVHGDAKKGVDALAELYAMNNGLPFTRYPANWRPGGVYDNAAGYKRNVVMAEESGAKALLAIWDGRSRGTNHMITIARDRELKVYVVKIETRSVL